MTVTEITAERKGKIDEGGVAKQSAADDCPKNTVYKPFDGQLCIRSNSFYGKYIS